MKIIAPSRIHMSLIDLNGSLGRVDGGIGLALESPSISINAQESMDIRVRGPMSDRAEDAVRKVKSYLNVEGGIDLEIESSYPQHIGLGSGTQVSLASASIFARMHDLDVGTVELAEIVGRGGTSGIGMAAFDRGGFILDGGHSRKVKKDFLPSAASLAPPPPILARYDFPDWKILLAIPKEKFVYSGKEEVNIFQKYCPIPDGEVRKLSRIILMGVLPSILERDVETFGKCINTIQGVGFKKIEVGLQSDSVREILSFCQENSFCAGLSSFGPVVYSFLDEDRDLVNLLRERQDIEEIIITKANNKGAVIED